MNERDLDEIEIEAEDEIEALFAEFDREWLDERAEDEEDIDLEALIAEDQLEDEVDDGDETWTEP